MDKKPLIGVSICAVALLVLGSFSNVVGCQTDIREDTYSTSGIMPDLTILYGEDGTENSKKITSYKPIIFDWGVDQKNTQHSGFGITLHPPQSHAQSFTPTKDKLTAVSLYLFKGITPPEPVHITVSIRDNLTGSNLVTKTINTSVVTISKSTQWVLFDFEDISITPDITYYIVCSVDAGNPTNSYCWLFANNDTYARGEAWFQPGENNPWVTWPSGSMYPVDFCFKTYFRKPLDSSVPTINTNLVNYCFFS